MLPNLIVIGAMKCGTTSLHYYLNLHPEIQMSKIKELSYFVEHRNWHRGLKWYKSHFSGDMPIHGEATPAYTMYPRFSGVPERMYNLIPAAKLIYIVRDPIKRILSEYMHHNTGGLENRSLETVITSGYADSRYIARSKYYFQIEQYLPFFAEENIHILTTEALGADRNNALEAIFGFLGVDRKFTSRRFNWIKNATGPKRRLNPTGRRIFALSEQNLNRYQPGIQRSIVKKLIFPFTTAALKPELSDELRWRLVEEISDDVEKLRAFTGNPFKEWSI